MCECSQLAALRLLLASLLTQQGYPVFPLSSLPSSCPSGTLLIVLLLACLVFCVCFRFFCIGNKAVKIKMNS